MRKPRAHRAKEKGVPKGYDSTFEKTLHKKVLSSKWIHIPTPSPDPISYHVEHKYHTDFILIEEDGKEILLEAKGRFWDYEEYNKYIWIKKALTSEQELVFLFAQPSAAMPATKTRKDGTKFSHAEWATRNGFRHFDEFSLPKEWKR